MTVISLLILVILIILLQCADHNYGQEEADCAEPSTSCSTTGDREEYPYSLEPTNEFALDGEVGTRLDQMTLIPVSLTCITYHQF